MKEICNYCEYGSSKKESENSLCSVNSTPESNLSCATVKLKDYFYCDLRQQRIHLQVCLYNQTRKDESTCPATNKRQCKVIREIWRNTSNEN